MYFQEKKTQVQIGKALEITQPMVSQHLVGKKRRGKKVMMNTIRFYPCFTKP